MALPQDDGGTLIYSSTQHPDEVQRIIAHATGRDAKDIVVICRRMGGAFGGKESQAALIGVIAALAADRLATKAAALAPTDSSDRPRARPAYYGGRPESSRTAAHATGSTGRLSSNR